MLERYKTAACYSETILAHMLRYFAGLKRVLFSENQPKLTKVSNFAFILPRYQL